MLAGNAKNGMRSPNDLLRYRSWVCPSHNENTTRHWKHATTDSNNVTLSETVGRGGDVGGEGIHLKYRVICHRALIRTFTGGNLL